jgi:hypothetical protein
VGYSISIKFKKTNEVGKALNSNKKRRKELTEVGKALVFQQKKKKRGYRSRKSPWFPTLEEQNKTPYANSVGRF